MDQPDSNVLRHAPLHNHRLAAAAAVAPPTNEYMKKNSFTDDIFTKGTEFEKSVIERYKPIQLVDFSTSLKQFVWHTT